MTTFKFVHTADIHLDSPLKGLTKYEGVAVDRILSATRDTFVNLVDRCIEERIAFLVIAGDLYDGDWKDYNTGLFFVDQMSRLNKNNVPVYITRGNHDALNQMTTSLPLPPNTHVFGSNKPASKEVKNQDVVVHGQSYSKRNMDSNLASQYPNRVDGMFNIGVLHTALSGREGHANYAPCTLRELIDLGYEYWALGHVHKREVLHEYPHVLFCGNLQGRHIKEDGAKSASIVTVSDNRVEAISEWECDVVRWTRLPVNVEDCSSFLDIKSLITEKLEVLSKSADESRVSVVRIQLTGTAGMYGELLGSIDELTADVRALALDVDNESLWIDRLVNETEPPSTNQVDQPSEAMLLEIRELLDKEEHKSELLDRLHEDFNRISLPSEVKTDEESEIVRMLNENEFESVLRSVSNRLVSQIGAGE